MKKYIGIWIGVVLVLNVLALTFFYFTSKEENLEEEVLGNESVNFKDVPYISSVPIQSVYEGEKFKYLVEVSDLDTPIEDVDIFLNEKPSWMYIEGNMVQGVAYPVGTYKYVVTASDGINSSSQVNYLLVLESE